MTPYKIKILQDDEDLDLIWNDFWLDLDSINGFYVVPMEEMIQGESIKVVVVYVNGENFTLKPEKHLENYLLARFVDKAKVC